jgi:hypothetical protein
MFKRLILIVIAVFVVGSVKAGSIAVQQEPTQWITVLSSALINGTGISSATAVCIENAKAFSYYIQVMEQTAGSPNVQLEYQVTTSTREANISENRIDAVTTRSLVWTTPATNGILDDSITGTAQCDGFSPIVTKLIKLKVSGVAGNSNRTFVTLKIGIYCEK